MVLGNVRAIYSAHRLRMLDEHSAYVIAGANRGQLGFIVLRDCTGDFRKKP